jgi:hypothetical protein
MRAAAPQFQMSTFNNQTAKAIIAPTWTGVTLMAENDHSTVERARD